MSEHSVLAAAAALREFTVDEVAAFCAEKPQDIIRILDRATDRIQRVEATSAERGPRWRVVDLKGLRRDLSEHGESPPRRSADVARTPGPPSTRLQLAEETLAECASEPSAAARQVLVATAQNYLRQVVAQALPQRPAWWATELSASRLTDELDRHPDAATSTRLQLDIAMARLAECDASGRQMPLRDLIAAVRHVETLAPLLDELRLHPLVGHFVDLVTAQLALPRGIRVNPPCRLIIAVARRRVRAWAHDGVAKSMRGLLPLLENVGRADADSAHPQLFRLIGHLPDGRDHVVVYADLLALLPRRLEWRPEAERLPGAVVEAVAEPAASTHLRRCATALTQDLVRSPYRSESALIGQAAHVFQEFADRSSDLDQATLSKTRSELLTLAKAPSWAPATRTAQECP
jgi:hypothetical protein